VSLLQEERKPLRVGYLRQTDSIDLSQLSATVLHMQAVIQGLTEREHQVRTLTLPQGVYKWSDDWHTWHAVPFGWLRKPPFRLLESGIRRLQSMARLPYFNLFDSLRFAQAAITVCREVDVFYERYWFLNYGGLLAARRLQIPLIIEVNGDIVEEYEQLGIELSAAQWRVIRFINKQILTGADHVITVSEPLRQRLLDTWQVAPERVTTVDNGAHVNLFARPSLATDGLKTQYGLNGGPLVMFVGTFKPWHGLDLLIRAFGQTTENHPQARLVLVGDGPMREQMRATAETHNIAEKVIFTGMVAHEEVASLLSLADVAVLSPRVSGAALVQSPLKLFEYMAAGKAIVAPAIPNVAAIITDQENGLLVAPDSEAELAQALDRLLADDRLRRQLGQTAQGQALTRHSWETAVTKIESLLYAEVEAGKGKR
jgi:glycosyltransferase involved in cell wall biosynthesis